MHVQTTKLRQSLLMVVIGFAVIVGINVYEYGLARDLRKIVAANDNLQRGEVELQRLFNAVGSAESAQRGFLLTRDASYLQAAAKAAALRSITAIQALTSFQYLVPDEEKRQLDQVLRELPTSIRAKFAEMDRALALAQSTVGSDSRGSLLSERDRVATIAIRDAAAQVGDALSEASASLLAATNALGAKDAVADLVGILLELPLFLLAVLLFHWDNVQLRCSETQLQEATRAAKSANESKSAFLAAMSHEIRTPLGVMIGYADMLTGQYLSEDGRCYAESIQRNGQVLLQLINDILDLAKIEAGKIAIDRQAVAPLALIKDVATQLRLKAQQKALRLTWAVDGVIPASITTDELRLRQILMNIVGNAIKFTGHGEVAIRVGLARDQANQSTSRILLKITVKDTGPGIAAADQAKIFAPFTQATTDTSRKFGGTGLGLSIARNLARVLGGDLWLESSQPGSGSVFAFTVDPGALADTEFVDQTAAMDSTAPATAAAVPAFGDVQALAGTRILVVDDFPDNQRMIRAFLTRQGADVDVAGDGATGVALALAKNHDLVIMDIQMPVMSGYTATEKLRESGYAKPVIALSAEAMQGELDRCRASGFSDYLSKPIRSLDLIATVQRHLLTGDDPVGLGRVANHGASPPVGWHPTGGADRQRQSPGLRIIPP